MEKSLYNHETNTSTDSALELIQISLGLLKHLAINHTDEVWRSFNGWLRTIREGVNPSEMVVFTAMRATFSNFLGAEKQLHAWAKFMKDRLASDRTVYVP